MQLIQLFKHFLKLMNLPRNDSWCDSFQKNREHETNSIYSRRKSTILCPSLHSPSFLSMEYTSKRRKEAAEWGLGRFSYEMYTKWKRGNNISVGQTALFYWETGRESLSDDRQVQSCCWPICMGWWYEVSCLDISNLGPFHVISINCL